MTSSRPLPDIVEVLGPLLRRVPVEQQPLLIAYAERLAAQRYRGWAGQVAASERKSELLACAEREEEIARRIEGLYPEAATLQRTLVTCNPELAEINRSLFASLSIDEQFTLQARGERIGAATWRSFAARAGDTGNRDVFLSCAILEAIAVR
jgi:hypothetical protein